MAAASFSIGYHHNHSQRLGSNKKSTKLTILPKMLPAIRLRSVSMNAYKQESLTPQVKERIESVASKTLESALRQMEEEKAREAALEQDKDCSPFILIADIFLSWLGVLATYYIFKNKTINLNPLMRAIYVISPSVYCLLLGLFASFVFSLAWRLKKRFVAFMKEVRDTYKDDDISNEQMFVAFMKRVWEFWTDDGSSRKLEKLSGDYFEANVYLGSPGRFEVTKYWKKVDEEESKE